MKPSINVVSFSGGRDSTALLLLMLEHNYPIDKIVFVDFGKEFPQLYAHIEKVKQYIKPIQIVTLSLDYDYYLGDYKKVRGKLKGSYGYGFPDFNHRWCTSLKVRTIHNYIKDPNAMYYLGICHDEPQRLKTYYNKIYLLDEFGLSEDDALQYCYAKGFTWDGLYESFVRASCWCCPFKRMDELRLLYRDFPFLWQQLEEMQNKSWRKFTSIYTVQQLTQKFKQEIENKTMRICLKHNKSTELLLNANNKKEILAHLNFLKIANMK